MRVTLKKLMRKKADEHGAAASEALASAEVPPPAAAAAARDTTTIGRYIARFRYEQPLPREERVGVQKDDFWWKVNGDSRSSHRRSRFRQQQQSALERESRLDVSSVSDSSAPGSSITSGYERYTPELHLEHKASNNPAPVSDRRPVVPAHSTLSSNTRDDALLLSSFSASWNSMPSDLEPPSSSSDHATAVQELARLPSRHREPPRDTVRAAADCHIHPYEEATALFQDEEEQEEAQVEDAELVIERVRKRLGWSSSDSSGLSDHSLAFQYDTPSPSPRHAKWRLPRSSEGSGFPPFPAAVKMAPSPIRSAGDDEVLSGTMMRMDDEVTSLEIVLSELSSSCEESRTAFQDPVDFSARFRKGDFSMSAQMTKSDADKLANFPPQVTLPSEAPVTTPIADFETSNKEEESYQRAQDVAVQTQLPEARRDTASELSGTVKIDTVVQVPAAKVREEPSAELNASLDAEQTEQEVQDPQETETAVAPLRSAESPVLPTWRRGSDSRSSSPIAPPTSSPSPTSLSSQSSVTAETAKTLDGLVSLVVQSWSNDFFFGAEADNNDEELSGADTVAENLERESTSGNELDAHDVRVHEELEIVDGPRESDCAAVGLPVADETSNGPSLVVVEPSDLPAPAAVAMDSSTESVSLEENQEIQEESEMEGDEDDEIVRLLLARIALYEQALRRLDEDN